MKYMLLIRSSAERWATMTDAERAAIGGGTMAISAELQEQGRYVDGAGLADQALTRTAHPAPSADEVVVTDGPYAEAKEHLAGFLLVECDSEDEAIALAARLPDASYAGVDIRPTAPTPVE